MKFAKTKKISLETTIMSTTLAQKREAIEKNKAAKQAFHNKMLAIICEDHGLPACLAPYVRFNKCSISLVAKNNEALIHMCLDIIENQHQFASLY